jgi:hypothetical protein
MEVVLFQGFLVWLSLFSGAFGIFP